MITPGSRSPPRISSAASTTAPSTQPPDTEPATSLASLTAIAAPASRGLDPTTPTTRAIAARSPGVLPALDVGEHLLQRHRLRDDSPRDHRRHLFERRERMALHEHVNVRQRRRHPLRERRVARGSPSAG